MATLRAAQGTLLPALLLLAGLHSASAALIRPLFQVSDEITYFGSLQRSALALPHDALLAPCLSPPDGAPPPVMPEGGKWLFHATGARLLLTACAGGAGPMAPMWLRLVFSLTLPVIAWAAWHSTRLVTGGTWAPAVAALAVATQPVLAKYAGAVTPDSLANACAALAITLALRTLVLGPTPWRVLAMLAWTGLAAAIKDSTLFLVPLHGLVLAASLLRSGNDGRRQAHTRPVAAAGIVIVLGLAVLTRTRYEVGPGVRVAMEAPVTFASRVASDALAQLWSLLASAWTSLGGFGAISAPLPTTAVVVVVTVSAAIAAGLIQVAAAPRREVLRRIAWYLVLAVMACLLQAPVRQVLLGTVDLHQGRWLFPVTVPVALAAAVGLERALGRKASRTWPLLAMAGLLLMALPWLSVTQWHLLDPAWRLDRAHLFLFSTGGLDVDPGRVQSIILDAWPAARGTVLALAAAAVVCFALLLVSNPAPESLTHVRHADDR